MAGTAILMSEYQALSDQIRDLNAGVMSLVEEFSGFRGEVRTGIAGMHQRQDQTNGRVTSLEADRARMLVNQAAQDAFTPGLFKTIDELKQECKGRHERLDAAIVSIQQSEAGVQVKLAHGDGLAKGEAKFWGLVWIALGALASVAAWAWQNWLPKWFAASK